MSTARRSCWTAMCLAGFACVSVTLLAPAAFAQSAGSAELILPEAPLASGEPFVATFRVQGQLLDLAVQDHITCVLLGETGDQELCEWRGELATARLTPSSIDFMLPLVAPGPGAYELRVTRDPIADAGVASVTAEAKLVVADRVPESPLDAGGDNAPEGAPAGGASVTNVWNVFFGGGAPHPGPDGKDAARWMVSSTAGSATVLLLLVATRRRP